MKKFYIRGIAFTSEGTFVFEERNLKEAMRKLKIMGIERQMIIYKKLVRKGKVDSYYKMAISVSEENKIETNYIATGGIKDDNISTDNTYNMCNHRSLLYYRKYNWDYM